MKSKDKLKKVSHHLCYEYEQLVNTARILGDCPCGQSTYNVLLDSFALHVRNLVDFLYTENPGSDDVYAGDFFASKQNWIDIRPAITPILEEAKKKTNKQAAHLTYKRLQYVGESKKWPFKQISEDLVAAFDVFLKCVDRDLLGLDLQKLIDNKQS